MQGGHLTDFATQFKVPSVDFYNVMELQLNECFKRN